MVEVLDSILRNFGKINAGEIIAFKENDEIKFVELTSDRTNIKNTEKLYSGKSIDIGCWSSDGKSLYLVERRKSFNNNWREPCPVF